MGFAVPAALGVHMARPEARVVAIVGDGAFQMTGMELSNLVRHKFPTVVIVLDNGGYGTERLLHPGDWEFNDDPPVAVLPAAGGAWAAARATKFAPKASSTRRSTPPGTTAAARASCTSTSTRRDCSRSLAADGGADGEDGGAKVVRTPPAVTVGTRTSRWRRRPRRIYCELA